MTDLSEIDFEESAATYSKNIGFECETADS